MISRALAKDISDFRVLIESHLARMIHEFQLRTRGLPAGRGPEVLKAAMTIAFRQRNNFDPQLESITSWFGACVDFAQEPGVVASEDEELAVLALQLEDAEEQKQTTTDIVREATDATQKPGKECPPCFRCRYFDGWLPRKEPKKADYSATEIGWICYEIDQRKIAIANYVRGNYPEELLED